MLIVKLQSETYETLANVRSVWCSFRMLWELKLNYLHVRPEVIQTSQLAKTELSSNLFEPGSTTKFFMVFIRVPKLFAAKTHLGTHAHFNFFHFLQFTAKNLPNNRFFLKLTFWEILDPLSAVNEFVTRIHSSRTRTARPVKIECIPIRCVPPTLNHLGGGGRYVGGR